MIVENKRHIAKAITYRLLSSSIGFFILYITTGSVKVGAAFSAAELIVKPIIYYIHERVYYRFINFGLKKPTNNTMTS